MKYCLLDADYKKHSSDSLVRLRKHAYNMVEPEYPTVVIFEESTSRVVGVVRLRLSKFQPWRGTVTWEGKHGVAPRSLNKDGTVREIYKG